MSEDDGGVAASNEIIIRNRTILRIEITVVLASVSRMRDSWNPKNQKSYHIESSKIIRSRLVSEIYSTLKIQYTLDFMKFESSINQFYGTSRSFREIVLQKEQTRTLHLTRRALCEF